MQSGFSFGMVSYYIRRGVSINMSVIFYVSTYKGEQVYPCVVLIRSDWDDFSYKTNFYLQFFESEASKPIKVGATKIAKISQKPGRMDIPDKFSRLDDIYFSLGQSDEYYENIKNLPGGYGSEILVALCDLRYNPEKTAKVRNELVFKRSLVRNLGALKLVSEGEGVASPDEKKLSADNVVEKPKSIGCVEDFKIDFSCSLQGSDQTTECDFSFSDNLYIPGRINVVVGKNGVGKTQLLANLVGAVTGIGKTEHISDSRAKISKVFAISYSVFDKFFMPNDVKIPRSTRRQDFLENYAKYDYIGIRDKSKSELLYRVVGSTTLSKKFIEAIRKIKADNALDSWYEAMAPIFNEANLSPMADNERLLAANFRRMGAGHKVSISILTCLFSKLGENSLVVMDEPENHLHPSLLSSTMHALRSMLDIKKSYAIVSTHSPIVIQETPARFIRVMSKIQGSTRVDEMMLESLGTSLDTLASNIFGIHSEMPDYRAVLKRLAVNGFRLTEVNEALKSNLSAEAATYFLSVGGKM